MGEFFKVSSVRFDNYILLKFCIITTIVVPSITLDFEEGPLTFKPTYKYQPGTDLYEQRPDKKLRAPAWCDRILW